MSAAESSRRDFLKQTTLAGAGLAASTALLAEAPAAEPRDAAGAKQPGAHDRIRVGVIGCGGQGTSDMHFFMRAPEVEVVALADVDPNHLDFVAAQVEKLKYGKRPAVFRDYRKLLDDPSINAVIIGTPDHWHAIPMIYACLAGKDVYCEKPISHNILEGRRMVEAARKYDRVCQVGTQQRSGKHFQEAVRIVRSGQIGQVSWVQTWNFENIAPAGIGNPPDTEPPPGVDYDMWLGPAPKRPFNRNRFHLLFRWFFDYAGGMMTDWGVHLNDIVLWAMNVTAPTAVSTSGGKYVLSDNRDTPDTMQVVYDFPGWTLTYSMRKGNGRGLDGHQYGIEFYGTDGTLFVDRDGYQVFPEKMDWPYGLQKVIGQKPQRTITTKPQKVSIPGKKQGEDQNWPHVQNFLHCMKTRARPISDIEVAHYSTVTCHLANIAYKVRRKLRWDPQTETFPNDPEANQHLGREYRPPYVLPAV